MMQLFTSFHLRHAYTSPSSAPSRISQLAHRLPRRLAMSEQSAATPLIAGASGSPSPPSQSALRALRFHHWLSIALLALYLIATFIISLTSLWTLLSFFLLLILFTHASYSFLITHKPTSLPSLFLLSQATLGALVVPIPILILVVVVMLALLVPTVLSLLAVLAIFSALHPDAMQTLSQPPHALDARALSQTIHAAVPHLSLRTVAQKLTNIDISRISVARHAVAAMRAGQGAKAGGKLWHKLEEAGIPPGDMIAVVMLCMLIVLSFVICMGVGVHAVVEYVRWRLFTRYVKAGDAENEDRASAAERLGVQGLVTVALVGAFAMAMGGVANAVVAASPGRMSLYQPTLYAAIVLVVMTTLNVVVFVGSQLYVATVHAERMLLGSTMRMREVWVTSVVYNFAMMIVSVPPPSPNVPQGPPVLLFILVTAVKALIAFQFTKKAVGRFSRACEAEAEVA